MRAQGDMPRVVPTDRGSSKLKQWRTVQARATLAGFQSSVIDGDNGRPMLVVNRQALTCSFADLQDVEDWLASVED